MSKLEIKLKERVASFRDYCVIEIYHNGKMIHTHSDLMEPEDATFYRSLSWVPDLLEKVYKLGIEDGQSYEQRDLFKDIEWNIKK